MKKIITFVSLVVLGLSAHAQGVDDWIKGYIHNSASNSGTEVWYGPGNKVTTNGAFARGANAWSASGSGMAATESGAVALADGRAVVLTATRFAAAGDLAVAAARLASGPVGIIAVLAIPSVYNWITSDNAQHIRVNPGRTGVEIKDPSICSSNCSHYAYVNGMTGTFVSWNDSLSGAIASSIADKNAYWAGTNVNYPLSLGACDVSTSSCVVTTASGSSFNQSTTKEPTSGKPESWLPASMDDIAPYMSVRSPPQSYPDDILRNGGSIDVSPVSITGPNPPLASPSPFVQTTNYPSPADKVGTSTTAGNPFGLAPNSPTVTSTSSGTTTVQPGGSSSTGPVPSTGAPAPQSIKAPTTTTTTSTFNPTSSQTTSQTVTTAAPQTQTTTVANVTNVTNTTNTSTVTNTTNSTTTTTNNNTNVTTTTTNNAPTPTPSTAPTPAPTPDPCDANPDRVGCLKAGDSPTSDTLVKKTTAVTITAIAFTSASACPAPLSFTVIGRNYGVSYQPLCDRLAMLRYLFLAMAAFVAAWSLASLFKV